MTSHCTNYEVTRIQSFW